jgi:hypothetical protein
MKSQIPERWKTFFSAHIPFVQIGLILLLGIASYANSLAVPLQFDDPTVVRSSFFDSNDLYRFQAFFRRPRWFVDISFAMNRYLHGEQVLGFHLVNLAIHLSVACVVYLFVQRAIEALKLTFTISEGDECSGFLQRFIPFTTAALFVCHPIQTQAVTYIAQRYASLATLLYVSSLLSYLMARLSFADEARKFYVWSWGLACFLFAILAMKSKEIAFTLPLMALLLEFGLFRGQLLKNRIYLALGAGLLLVIPLQLIYIRGTDGTGNLLQHIQSAATETPLISRTDYLLTQLKVVATYLRLLILPINQHLDYDYPLYHTLFNPAVFTAFLLHVTLVVLALAFFIRSRRYFASRTPSIGIAMRLASLGICWFYLALSVESSLVPIRDVIVEHRIYLPSVGFIMAMTACLAGIAAYGRRNEKALWGGILLLCLVFTASTIARNRIWSDETLLWQDSLNKSPNRARASWALGTLYFRKLLPEKALPHFVKAVELEPAGDIHWININSVIRALKIYSGRSADGLEFHATIVTIEPIFRKPWMAISYNNLGLAYEHIGNLSLAQENYQKAVAVNPTLDLAWYNLALIAARRNDSATVVTSRERLRAINPQLEQHAAETIRVLAPSVELVPQ